MSTRNVNSKPSNALKKGGQKKAKSSAQISSSSHSAPVAISKTIRSNEPSFKSMPKGSIRVAHREFLANLAGSVDWGIQKFLAINPGNTDIFPWLHAVGTRFETYQFHSLRFYFESMAPTTSPGVVMMAVDFEAADPRPQSKVIMMSYQGAVRANTWDCVSMPCSYSNLNKIKEKFVLDHVPPNGQDVRLFNVGNLLIATQGQADTAVIGELYVEYDVTFHTPQIDTSAEGIFVEWGVDVDSTHQFGTASTYTTNPPADTTSDFGFGTAAGLAASAFAIYKTGVYLWDSMFGASGTGATYVAPNITSVDGNATISTSHTYTTINATRNVDSNVNSAQRTITVNKAPAVFTVDSSPAVGATLKAGSSFRLTPRNTTSVP